MPVTQLPDEDNSGAYDDEVCDDAGVADDGAGGMGERDAGAAEHALSPSASSMAMESRFMCLTLRGLGVLGVSSLTPRPAVRTVTGGLPAGTLVVWIT